METISIYDLNERVREIENEIAALEDEKRSIEREVFYLENPECMPEGYAFENQLNP